MSHYILYYQGRYNVYSTGSESPVFNRSVSREELVEYIRKKEGQDGLDELPQRLKRAFETGSSVIGEGEDLESAIICNRAGPDETNLSLPDFITKFLVPPYPEDIFFDEIKPFGATKIKVDAHLTKNALIIQVWAGKKELRFESESLRAAAIQAKELLIKHQADYKQAMETAMIKARKSVGLPGSSGT